MPEWYISGGFALGAILLLMFLSMPVAFAFLAVSFAGMYWLAGTAGLSQVVANASVAVTHFVFLPIPLFLLMGELFFNAGVAQKVFDAVDMLIGRMRGRLSYVTVFGGTTFAALTGTSMGNTAMLGSLLVPEDSRRFPAKHWNARGISWVPVNYRLTPDHALADCVEDARAAVAWLAANADAIGIDPSNLHLAGNSAGGHLAAMVAAADWADGSRPQGIRSLCAISGLFDLHPLLSATANNWLGLDDASARTLSPQQHLPPSGIPVLVGCGGAETTAFKDQSRNYAQLCRQAGNPLDLFESPDADHFRIIGEFGVPGSPLFDRLQRQIEKV